MKVNVPLRRKDAEIETTPCEIEKTLELTTEDFDDFTQNLLSDYDFIRDHLNEMYRDENGISHCLLVLGKGREDGILVESEGSAYARYSAFLPNARRLLRQEQKYEPVLRDFCDRMQTVMEEIVRTAPMLQQDGMLRIALSELAPAHGEYPPDFKLLHEMVCARPEFLAAELFDDELVLQMDPKYLPTEEALRRPTEEELQIMCAKHLLWAYGEGGEQADFSGCDLSELDLSGLKLNGAIFTGANLWATSLERAELCFADFSGAVLENCNAKSISADEAVFKNAVLLDCDLSNAQMEHCNFTGADLTGTTLWNARMRFACLDGATLPDCAYEQADIRSISMNEQTWSGRAEPVLSL